MKLTDDVLIPEKTEYDIIRPMQKIESTNQGSREGKKKWRKRERLANRIRRGVEKAKNFVGF